MAVTPLPRLDGERVFALIVSAIGLGVALWSLRYELVVEGRLGPGMLPFILGAGLVLTAGPLVLPEGRRGVRFLRRAPSYSAVGVHGAGGRALAEPGPARSADQVPGAEPATDPQVPNVLKAGLVLGLLAGSVALGQAIGFVLALTCFMFVIARWVERERWTNALYFALFSGLVLHLIFERLLAINLPGPSWW